MASDGRRPEVEEGDDGELYETAGIYRSIEFSCSDAPEAPIEKADLMTAQGLEFLDAAPMGKCPALQLLTKRVGVEKEGMAEQAIPYTKAIVEHAVSPLRDYALLWRSQAGGSACLTSYPPRFMVQTPDDDGPFCSFALTVRGIFVKGVYTYNDPIFEPTRVMRDSLMVSGWRREGNQILGLPISFLKIHVASTAQDLAKLSRRVSNIENEVSEPQTAQSSDMDFADLSLRLHGCSTTLIKLERRARFEQGLVESIETFLSRLGSGQNGVVQLCNSRLGLQKSMIQAAQQEFESLPKRIENQRTMIFNLIVQRDQRLNTSINRANMEIAENARQIAQATMADSAAMKTIAIMTMIFLPGTAVASFFSMTMFDWTPEPGESIASGYLWVYFVTAVPLTGLVMAIWLYCYKTRQARLHIGNVRDGEDTRLMENVIVQTEQSERSYRHEVVELNHIDVTKNGVAKSG